MEDGVTKEVVTMEIAVAVTTETTTVVASQILVETETKVDFEHVSLSFTLLLERSYQTR